MIIVTYNPWDGMHLLVLEDDVIRETIGMEVTTSWKAYKRICSCSLTSQHPP